MYVVITEKSREIKTVCRGYEKGDIGEVVGYVTDIDGIACAIVRLDKRFNDHVIKDKKIQGQFIVQVPIYNIIKYIGSEIISTDGK